MEMEIDLQETLKISIHKQFCYYCAVSFDNVSSFENHQCEERTHVLNGDSSTNTNVSIDLNETRLDDLGIDEHEYEQDLTPVQIKIKPKLDPVYLDHNVSSATPKPPPGFLSSSSSRKRKSPIELQRKELKVKRRKKRHPLKCIYRGCSLLFPSDEFLSIHLKISHQQQPALTPVPAAATTNTTISSSSSSLQIDQEIMSDSSSSLILDNRSLSNITKIDMYCRTCDLDFSSAPLLFDHLFLPPHTLKPNEEKESKVAVEEKKENGILSEDLKPNPNPSEVSPSPVTINENGNNSDNNSGHNIYDDDDDDGMDSFFEPINHTEFTTNNNNSSNNNNHNDSDSECGINSQPPIIFNDAAYEKQGRKKKKFSRSNSRFKSKSKSTSTVKTKETPKEKLPRGRKPKLRTCPEPECKDLTFLTKSNLISHQRRVHPIPQEEKRKFKCPYDNCDRVCTEKANLKAHILRVHERHKDFLCNVCAKTFFDDISLRQHQLIHYGGEKKFKCKTCSKTFRHRSTLSRHVSIHTGEHNYLCVTCGRSFRTADAHRVHLRIHADVRMFPCPVCPAAHNHKATLQKHVAAKHPEWEGTI